MRTPTTASSMILLLAVVLTGCSNGIPNSFDSLTEPRASLQLQNISLDDFISRITADEYDTVRDSLVTQLAHGTRIQSHLATIDSAGIQIDVDTVLFDAQDIRDDMDGVGWIAELLPEGQIFLTARNTDQFVYSSADDSSGTTVLRAQAIPGQDIPGGLQTISIYLNSQTGHRIDRIEVHRDGGGLFFREKSLLEMTLDDRQEFDSLDYTVVLRLPFRGVAAYRTEASVINGSA